MTHELHNVICSGKLQITTRNQIFAIFSGMTDDFSDLKETWQRVKWARMKWFARSDAIENTAKRAAESLGLSVSTYSQYEREPGTSRSTPLNIEYAKRFAKKFKVNWLWLLTGEGTPFGEQQAGPMLRIENTIKSLTPEEQERAAQLIEVAFSRKDGTAG